MTDNDIPPAVMKRINHDKLVKQFENHLEGTMFDKLNPIYRGSVLVPKQRKIFTKVSLKLPIAFEVAFLSSLLGRQDNLIFKLPVDE